MHQPSAAPPPSDGEIGFAGKPHSFERHSWVKAIPMRCLVCNKHLKGVHRQGLQCRACGKAVHDNCQAKAGLCQTPYEPFFLGATCPNAKPLFVFVNPKSGAQKGRVLLPSALALLGSGQVFDIMDGGPELYLLQIAQDGAFPTCQFLVAGGDGSANWVLGAMDKLQLRNEPPVAVLPLGTGNDLSRALGWGGGYDKKHFGEALEQLQWGVPLLLDRWRVRVKDHPERSFNNYFSMGVDAGISLGFHEAREKDPTHFRNRELNKLAYAKCAVGEFSTGSDLRQYVTVLADGQPVPLPEHAHGLIALNITSYASGADLWHSPAGFRPQSMSDQLLEVCTVSGVPHLGVIQAKTSKGKPLCQCRTLTITTGQPLPMQVDGEPWTQDPTVLEVSFLRQSEMLRNSHAK